jgi:hypothetical protein
MTILLTLAVLAVFAAIAIFVRNVLKTEREFQEKEEETFTKYRKVLDKAHAQARALLYTTSLASSELMTETKQTNETVTEDLDKVLQTIAQKHIHYMNEATQNFQNAYAQYLAELQTKFQEQQQNTLHLTQDTVSKSLQEFSQSLSAKTVGIQESIDKKTTEQLEQVEKDISDYKTMRLKKIDEEVSRLVQKSFQEVLRRSISEPLHEELILEALEKAKKEEVLTL